MPFISFTKPAASPWPAPSAVPPGPPKVATPVPPERVLLVVNLVVMLALFGWFYHTRSDTTPAPANGVKLGKSFAPALAGSLADGLEAMAADLEATQPLAKADEHLKAVFQANRQAAFQTIVAPALAAVVPDQTEPADAATRARYVRLVRDIAKGLRGGK